MSKLRYWLSLILGNKKLRAFIQGAGSILQLSPKMKLREYPEADIPKQAIGKAWEEVGRSTEMSALIALNERQCADGLPRLRDKLARMREKGIIDKDGNLISKSPIDEKSMEHDCDV